ncbi:MAG TPA: LptF/LptG family permease [Niabella sp.]|jgi:lipopolysaccharide export system permease protein|nr:LptF/LptG family permease [Chitinophagaceae bacterium]HRN48108.1 LptF/LptG family permease [Niabella sp.]HRO85339.1 LptF/LptG family permease [Niabella sp.]
MKILDWYIFKKLIITFIFCMLLFTVIAVAVDTSEKTDDFIKTGLTNWEIFTQYYIGFIPFIWSLLYPLFIFIAVIFFTSKMALRSEVIAILASGTTYNRFLRPYLIGGVLLAVVLFVGRRYLIPQANKIQFEFKRNYLDRNDPLKNRQETSCYNCFYKRIDSATYIGIKNYNEDTRTGGMFFMDRVKNGKVVYNLRAESIRWDFDNRRWMAYNVVERNVDSIGEKVSTIYEKPVWLKLSPGELIKDEYLKDKLTTPELKKFIQREKLRGTEGLNALQVELYKRTSTPFTVILLTFIGAVIASRRTRGGSGMHLALGIIIAAIFIIADQFSTVFSVKGNFPPLLAAWVPNMVFAIVAWRLYITTPK